MEFKVPDILSVSRAAASLLLLLLEPLSDEFLIAFTLIASTDLVDGFLARRFGISSYGKALDSSCDAVLAVVLLLCLIPNLDWEQWMIWWIAAIAAMRLVSIGIGSGRFSEPGFVHTYFNKAAGLFLFLSPFLLRILDLDVVVYLVCGVATISALEFLYINCTSRNFDGNYSGILFQSKV